MGVRQGDVKWLVEERKGERKGGRKEGQTEGTIKERTDRTTEQINGGREE